MRKRQRMARCFHENAEGAAGRVYIPMRGRSGRDQSHSVCSAVDSVTQLWSSNGGHVNSSPVLVN